MNLAGLVSYLSPSSPLRLSVDIESASRPLEHRYRTSLLALAQWGTQRERPISRRRLVCIVFQSQRDHDSNHGIASAPSIDATVPSKAAQLPEELFEPILNHLCALDPQHDRWGQSVYSPSLGFCALTCRHWATHVRHVLFLKVALKSENRARTFSDLVRSPVAVPGPPVGEIVQMIELTMEEESPHWMFHVWTILRDGILPNLQSINLDIRGGIQDSDAEVSPAPRHKCEILYDIGLPRRIPSVHPISLHTLRLQSLGFHSSAAFVRSLAYFNVDRLECETLVWPEPEGNSALAITGPPLPRNRRGLRASSEVFVYSCSAFLPFVWNFIKTRLPSAHVNSAARQLVYINPLQINTVISIIRLFTDDCECSERERMGRLGNHILRVFTGECSLIIAHIHLLTPS